jgi:hypothetical protein
LPSATEAAFATASTADLIVPSKPAVFASSAVALSFKPSSASLALLISFSIFVLKTSSAVVARLISVSILV